MIVEVAVASAPIAVTIMARWSGTRAAAATAATNTNADAALLGEAPISTPPAAAITQMSADRPRSRPGHRVQHSQATTATASSTVITSARPLVPGAGVPRITVQLINTSPAR